MIHAPKNLRLSLSNLLLLFPIVACVIVIVGLRTKLVQRENEILRLKYDYAIADGAQNQMVVAKLPQVLGRDSHWTWRLQFPDEGTYRLCYAFSDIPETALPERFDSTRILDVQIRKTLSTGSFLFSLALERDSNARWRLHIATADGKRGAIVDLPNAPKWLDHADRTDFTMDFATGTELPTVDDTSKTVLVRILKNQTGDRHKGAATEGLVFWIEREKE